MGEHQAIWHAGCSHAGQLTWRPESDCGSECRRVEVREPAAPETPSAALSEAIAVTLGDHQWSAIDPVCSCGWEWDLKAWCKTINTSADSLWVLKVAPTRRAAYERHVASIIAAPVEADRAAVEAEAQKLWSCPNCMADEATCGGCGISVDLTVPAAPSGADAAVERVRALADEWDGERVFLAMDGASPSERIRAALDGDGQATGAGVAEIEGGDE